MRLTRSAWAMAAGLGLLMWACGSDGGGGGGTGVTTGTVSGTVAAAGTGVGGATLSLERSGQTTRTTTSSASGAFSFNSVTTGGWTLEIAAPSGFELANGQAASVPVNVTAGQTSTVNVSLAEIPTTSSIRATVLSGAQGVADATLNLFEVGSTQARATQTTDANGVAFFNELEARAFDVEVQPPTGFVLAQGEDAMKRVTTTVGAQATVEFAVEPQAGGSVTVITASGTSFSDDDVTIDAGTTVRWINGDGVLHTVTPNGHSEWQEEILSSQGDTFEHTFDTPGTYAYFCSPHRSQGMTGIIRVQ